MEFKNKNYFYLFLVEWVRAKPWQKVNIMQIPGENSQCIGQSIICLTWAQLTFGDDLLNIMCSVIAQYNRRVVVALLRIFYLTINHNFHIWNSRTIFKLWIFYNGPIDYFLGLSPLSVEVALLITSFLSLETPHIRISFMFLYY